MKLGRKPRSILAIATTAVAVIAAFAITPSLASWTDTEYANGAVAPLSCAAPGTFTTTAWGQEVSGQVATLPLDPSLAGTLGVSATSGAPHSTATGGEGSAGLNYLTNDAWSNTLGVGALNSIMVSAGVALPIGQNLGVETQYGRATSTGLATGASGLLTDAGGGLVSLATPTGTTPGVGSISLDSALSTFVGTQLSSDITKLANVSLSVGAVGSTTDLDSCTALWQQQTDAASVVRHYLLAKLGLGFTSSLIGTATSTAAGSVNTITKASNATLASTLNLLQPLGSVTGATLTSVDTTLAGLLPGTVSGLPVSLGTAPTLQAGVTFDPSTVLSLLTSTITAGPVSINLGTGQIDADIAGPGGVNLNSLSPNSPLLTPALLASLKSDIATAIATFVTNTLGPALSVTLNSAAVNINISSQIALNLGLTGTLNVASLDVTAAGTLGNFLQPATYGPATVSVNTTAELTPIITNALSLLGLNLNTLLGTITSGLSTAVATSILPVVDTAVLTPVLTLATTDVADSIGALSGLLAPVETALAGVVDVLGDVVQLTVNAQPDQPAPVGSPEPAATGRFFESALKVGVLNGVGGTSVLALYLGSSSVGPNTEN
jgi:hypothetical protein